MGLVGIDTLAVAAPAVGWKRDPIHGTGGLLAGSMHISVGSTLPGGGFVSMIGDLCRVEASLPTRVHGTNVHPLNLPDALGALDDLLAVAEEHVAFVSGATEPDVLRVLRLDLDRDFRGVIDAGVLLEGLATVRQRQGHVIMTAREGGSGEVESLTVRPLRSGWHAMLYAKWAQSKDADASGVLRFETMLRKQKLRAEWATANGGKVNVVADLTEAKVTDLARGMFNEVGFDASVVTPDEAIRVLRADPNLSAAKRNGLIGYLIQRAAGFETDLSSGSVREYEKKLAELGVRVAPAHVRSSVRLDFDEGISVVDVAVA